MQTFSESAQYVMRFINQTGKSVFLTGKAGTGKTTLLREIIRTTHKKTVVVAPTGIAALNAGGVTIHSLFQLPFAAFLPSDDFPPDSGSGVRFETRKSLSRHFRMGAAKQNVIKTLELLVLDEVSMLRPDVVDAIDFMLRSVRRNPCPFGGVQVLFIGDLMQLPPVIRQEEWATLKNYYDGRYFFNSLALRDNPPVYIELTQIFRQTDSEFIDILNNLRNNVITNQDIEILNRYVTPNFNVAENPGHILLTTHNAKADVTNVSSLGALKAKEFVFRPEIVGEFPEKLYPVDERLALKTGAQVMFVKNDPSPEKNYFNGKTGVVKSIAEQEILVEFPEEGLTIEVDRYEWKNIRYSVNAKTGEIDEEVLGTFVHYPLRLAWAITVHKSQGLTFDKAALDVSDVFVPGQAYVALSRLRSLNGLILLSPIRMNGIASDREVVDYAATKSKPQSLEQTLHTESLLFAGNYLCESFDFSPLITAWQDHLGIYDRDARSAKNTFAPWAEAQFKIMSELPKPARKFTFEIRNSFASNVDLAHIAGRVQAASDYFFAHIDTIAVGILRTIEQAKRRKKTKALLESLSELYDVQSEMAIRLLRSVKLINTVSAGKEITKMALADEFISSYRSRQIELARSEFIGAEAFSEPEQKKRGEKTKKKSTYLETYELWQQKNSIKAIAAARKLTPQTISGHIAKLIGIKAIAISEVLSPEKIAGISEAFEGYDQQSLTSLKEQVGDRFTWDELRFFKASLTNKQPEPQE